MADVRRITLDEVVRHFEELEDPHCSIKRKHAPRAELRGGPGPLPLTAAPGTS